MVYITGDIHGDFSRFTSPAAKRLKAGDILAVCGDFGFFWDDSKQERRLRAKLEKLPYTIAFLDGRHENFTLLDQYPVTEWNGGRVQEVGKNLLHLMRGEIYEIEGESYFVFGGGESPDHAFRTEGVGWWEEEMPSAREILNGADNLEKAHFQVDYVLTHEPSGRSSGYLSADTPLNGVNVFLDRVEDNVTFQCWFFGCLHLDKTISSRHRAIFRDIVPTGGDAAGAGRRGRRR